MSKINTSYWGANVSPYNDGTYTYNWGVSTNNIRALLQANKYDPNTDSFDMSVSPWGIGYSAAGNRGQIAIQRQGSVDGNAPGVITKISFEGIDRDNSNRPFYIPTRGVGGARDNYNWISARVGGDCNINSDNYLIDKYNGMILAGDSTSSDCISNQYPCTFLDYQRFRLAISAFNYIDLDTGIISQYSFAKNGITPENAKTKFDNYNFPEHMAITTIYVSPHGYAMQVGAPTQWTSLPTPGYYGLMQMRGHTIGDAYLFNRIGLSAGTDDKYKLFAGWNLGAYGVNNTLNTYYILPRIYYSSSPYVRNIPVEGADYRPVPNGIYYSYVQVNGLGVGADSNYSTTFVSNYCNKEQSFDDIKYSQRPLLYTQDNGFTEIKEGYALQADSDQFRATSIYEVSGSDTFTKAQILALIKHEVAFYGFEFFIQWGNSYGGTWSVGDDDLYLPKFDEHLITTGLYTSGTASLAEENANWGNVFADDMPDYDVDYNPAPPEPGREEKDFGDLTNRIAYRQATQGTIKYVASYAIINQLQSFLNGTYLPDNPAFIADFKGTNPQDYIVSLQKYPFALPHHSTASIVIGRVDTNLSAGLLYDTGMGILPINSDCTFDFGEISVSRYFGDFRDYLSKITLMMPFIGSIDLDPKLYIDHTIGLQYLIDFDTGAVAAEIKRDGLTMETKTSTISITIPFFSANMGAYQNALAQTGFAIEQSKIKQIAGIMSTALSVGAGLASGGTMSDTATLGTAGGLIGGATSMISGQMQQQALEYELEHTAPQIGTISVAAPANAFLLDDRARLLITRPAMIPGYDAAVYSHTVGNACAIPGTLSSFSGYTVASAAELSSITARDGSGVSPTAEELRMIKQALQAGIYV